MKVSGVIEGSLSLYGRTSFIFKYTEEKSELVAFTQIAYATESLNPVEKL